MDGVEKQQQLFSDLDDTCAATGESDDGDVQSPAPIQTASDGVEDEVVYVIDSFSLIYQVFFGMPSMTCPAGQPINAIF